MTKHSCLISGTTLGSKGPGQISHYQAGLTLVGAGGTGTNPPMHNPNMGGINAANKFNTISNVHKRGGGGVGWNRSLLQEEQVNTMTASPSFTDYCAKQGQEPSHYERGGLLLNRRGGGGLVGELVPVTAVSLFNSNLSTSCWPAWAGGHTGRQHCLSHGDAEQGEQESGHGKRVGETATGEFGQKRANLISHRWSTLPTEQLGAWKKFICSR